MSVSVLLLEKFIISALFAIVALRGERVPTGDEGVRCDLILKPLTRGRTAGQQLQQGAQTFLGKEREVCDHIWFNGGISECKRSERERTWCLRPGGTNQDSLCDCLTHV